MNLLDALRHAEQQGKESVHRGAEKLHNIETSIRRKIRGRQAAAAQTELELEGETARSQQGRTGIVSVNGRDVGEMRCTGGRHPS